MSAFESLYQDLILDHAQRRVGETELTDEPGAHEARSKQYNPLCGDRITLQTRVVDGRVEQVSWTGDGCAISMASASMLTELATGESVEDFESLLAVFREMMGSRGRGEPDEDTLGDAVALHGVAQFPARIKCALLGWVAAEDAIRRSAAA